MEHQVCQILRAAASSNTANCHKQSRYKMFYITVCRDMVYSMTEKTQYPGFMFPQVVQRH